MASSFSTALVAPRSCQKPSRPLDQDDPEDDDGIGGVAEEEGQAGGEEEDQDDRALELREEQGRDVRALFRLQEVFPVDCETACRFAFRQALCGALKRKNQLRGGNGPVPVGGVHNLRHPVCLMVVQEFMIGSSVLHGMPGWQEKSMQARTLLAYDRAFKTYCGSRFPKPTMKPS